MSTSPAPAPTTLAAILATAAAGLRAQADMADQADDVRLLADQRARLCQLLALAEAHPPGQAVARALATLAEQSAAGPAAIPRRGADGYWSSAAYGCSDAHLAHWANTVDPVAVEKAARDAEERAARERAVDELRKQRQAEIEAEERDFSAVIRALIPVEEVPDADLPTITGTEAVIRIRKLAHLQRRIDARASYEPRDRVSVVRYRAAKLAAGLILAAAKPIGKTLGLPVSVARERIEVADKGDVQHASADFCLTIGAAKIHLNDIRLDC